MMEFHGGPLAGQTEEPHEGWPAPDVYKRTSFSGEYQRFEVDENGVHHYLYVETGSESSKSERHND